MTSILAQTLLGLGAIVTVARLLGVLAVRLAQPRIGGEMVGGLLVGGALLSPWRHAGAAHDAVLSGVAVHVIDVLGQLGVILYLMLVGLTLSPDRVRRSAGRIAAVALPVIAVATALAPLGVGWFAGGRWGLEGGVIGALVMDAALMVNGFPVVARILQERGLLHSELGATVLGASAIVTALPFVLLTLVAAGSSSAGSGPLPGAIEPVVALFGAFLAGIALSRSRRPRRVLEKTLGRSVPTILVPVFLAAAGARLDPRALDASVVTGALVFLGLLVAVPMLAAPLTARLAPVDGCDARSVTALLNCRGLMLLALGAQMADRGLIGSRLVAVFFIGAVATTLLTGPLLRRAGRPRHLSRSPVEAAAELPPE